MSPKFLPDGRDVRIDILRALAMIQVVFMHALMVPSVSTSTMQHALLYIPDTAGLFFLASGMLLFPVERAGRPGQWRYVWHRISSFLPEFVIFSVIYVLLDSYYGIVHSDLPDWGRICWMFVEPTWGPGWFVLALTGLYAVSPVISGWLERARRRDVEIVLTMWLASCFLPIMTPYVPVDIPRSIFGTLFNYAGFMLLGYYIVHWPLSERALHFRWFYFGLAAFGGLVCASLLAPRAEQWGFLDHLSDGLCINIVLVVALEAGAIMMLRPGSIPKWISRTATFISVCSLGFYCAHWYFVSYLGCRLGWDYTLTVVVTIAGSTVAAALMRYVRVNLRLLSTRRKQHRVRER